VICDGKRTFIKTDRLKMYPFSFLCSAGRDAEEVEVTCIGPLIAHLDFRAIYTEMMQQSSPMSTGADRNTVPLP
jgi:hypothetical protein